MVSLCRYDGKMVRVVTPDSEYHGTARIIREMSGTIPVELLEVTFRGMTVTLTHSQIKEIHEIERASVFGRSANLPKWWSQDLTCISTDDLISELRRRVG